MMEEAIGKASAAYEAKMEAEKNCKDQIRDERQHFWEKVARSKATAEAKLESERRGFQAIIDHLKQKQSREMNRLNTRLDDKDAEMIEVEDHHRSEMKDMQSKLDQQKELVHQEKQLRRQTVQEAADIKAQCTEHIKAMDLWLMDTAAELKVCIYCHL